jgi:hypothetical protein
MILVASMSACLNSSAACWISSAGASSFTGPLMTFGPSRYW